MPLHPRGFKEEGKVGDTPHAPRQGRAPAPPEKTAPESSVVVLETGRWGTLPTPTRPGSAPVPSDGHCVHLRGSGMPGGSVGMGTKSVAIGVTGGPTAGGGARVGGGGSGGGGGSAVGCGRP